MESALLSLLVQMDGIHGHLEQVGFVLRVLMVVEQRFKGVGDPGSMERESALLSLLVQMDGIHGHLEQVGFRTVVLGLLRVVMVVEVLFKWNFDGC
jgi:hypothetical protein